MPTSPPRSPSPRAERGRPKAGARCAAQTPLTLTLSQCGRGNDARAGPAPKGALLRQRGGSAPRGGANLTPSFPLSARGEGQAEGRGEVCRANAPHPSPLPAARARVSPPRTQRTRRVMDWPACPPVGATRGSPLRGAPRATPLTLTLSQRERERRHALAQPRRGFVPSARGFSPARRATSPPRSPSPRAERGRPKAGGEVCPAPYRPAFARTCAKRAACFSASGWPMARSWSTNACIRSAARA